MNGSGVCGAALAAALLAPAIAFAQGQLFTKMSVSVSQVYDGNLFASETPQADLISRAGPSLEIGFRSLPIEIAGRYEIQAERYVNHPELSAAASHQDGSVSLRYTPGARLVVAMDGNYLRTQTPSELNLGSGLGIGRAPAERVSVNTMFRYHLQPVTIVTSDYSFGNDTVAGGVSSTAQRWRAGIERREGTRNMYRLDYQLRQTDFGAGARMQSHAIMAGWEHSVTARTGFELAAGPRFTDDGTIRPEIAALVRRQLTRGELSFSYSSTELTAIGERGTIDVNRAAVSAHYRPSRRLDLSVTPAFIRSARGAAAVPVYAVDAESIVGVTQRISFTTWLRVGRQRGTLSGSSAVIPYRGVGITLRIGVAPVDTGAVRPAP
jgi:hypothetical protein